MQPRRFENGSARCGIDGLRQRRGHVVVLLGAAWSRGYCSNDDVVVVLRAAEDGVGEPLTGGLGSDGGSGAGGVRGVNVEVKEIDVVAVGMLRLVVSFTSMSQCAGAGKLGRGARV